MDDAVILDELVIALAPCTMIELIWDQVEPLIEMARAKAPDDVVTECVKQRLLGGKEGLVTISRGSKIIAINTLDVRVMDTGIRTLYIPITAGLEMDSWLDRFMEVAVAIAKDYECTELRGMAARDGWLRKLKPYGWEEVFTTIRYKFGE